MPRDNNKNEDDETPKTTTGEAGDNYESDGAVVADSDRYNGEESLAPPPPPFVPYGGVSEHTGDGFRRPGAFRDKYQCPTMKFSNITAIPFTRFG